MNHIVTIAIIIISMIALTSLWFIFTEQSEEKLEGYDCYVQLGLQKAGNTIPFLSFENACKTIVVDLPEKPRRLIDTKNDMSKEIAAKIVRAWDITHKGTISEGMWSSDQWLKFTTSDCMVLYELNIDYVPEDDYTQKDLYEYLLLTNFIEVDGLPKTYFSYVQNAGGPGALVFPEEFTVEKDVESKLPKMKHNEILIEKGNTYALSIHSPDPGTLGNWGLNDNIPKNNILMFSSLSYAEQDGCVRK